MSETTNLPSEPMPDGTFLLEEALEHHRKGEVDMAEDLYRQVLALLPEDFTAIHQLGVIQSQRRQFQAAADLLDRALKLRPKSALAHFNLGMALQKLGRPEEALSHYQYSLAITPNNPDALLNCAVTLHGLKRCEEALIRLDKLLALVPEHPEATLNRGIVLLELERLEDALASFDQALHLREDWGEVWLNRGIALTALGRPLEALASCDHALAASPNCVEAFVQRGIALLQVGRNTEALASLDQVLELVPEHAKTLVIRSLALQLLKRPQEALESCDRALAMDATDVAAHANRGSALMSLKRHQEALTSYERALSFNPENPEVLNDQTTALHQLGRHEEAIASARRALTLRPDFASAHTNLIFSLDYLPELGVLELQEERKRFFEAQAKKIDSTLQPFPNDRDPSRPLVLGYVSADFFHHSAAYCFGPLLKRHHKTEFKLICYSGVLFEDDLTLEFRQAADVWRNTLFLSDDELASQIRRDGVDILIDLSGHTVGNRLPVFARKPAPIQVTAWGHGGGTGLPMMDYQFTDQIVVPPYERPLYAEKSYDLPCCITFEPPTDAPEVGDPPVRAKKRVTFGSLNKFTKVTPEVLNLWAKILGQVPNSCLLLKDALLADPEQQRKVKAIFQKAGIEPERIELRGSTSRQQHLAAYHDVDIVLDTFPQNGGITTWEALWMGVPVITKLGSQLSSRISGAILHALDLEEWIGQGEDGYAALAVRQASDLEALIRFRQGIRSRIAGSPAGNPELYTQAVEQAYRAMWQRWLAI